MKPLPMVRDGTVPKIIEQDGLSEGGKRRTKIFSCDLVKVGGEEILPDKLNIRRGTCVGASTKSTPPVSHGRHTGRSGPGPGRAGRKLSLPSDKYLSS